MYADDGIGSTVLGQYSNRRSSHSAAPAGENDSTEIIYLPTANGPMPIAAQINGRLYAIDADHLNTPRRLTNQQGQVAWQWLITGFGEVNPTSGATGYTQAGIDNGKVYSERVSFNLRYPGQQWDEETGLSYNLNRYYDQEGGRYIQSDLIGLDGGSNRFAYVNGDPLNGIDPDGLNVVTVANWLAMRAQSLYYRYGPAITEFIAGASGVNGAVVSPMSPLVAQIPTSVSRMTPVARAVAEGIESGGFCAANDVVAAAKYFEGTKYSERVLGQMKSGDFHGFTRSVEAFSQYGKISTVIQPSTGLPKEMLNISGSYRGVDGTFEFVKHESGVIYHRLFRPN